MSTASSEPCISPEELGQRSLVDKLLEVDRLIHVNKKSAKWVQNLVCLMLPFAEGKPFRQAKISEADDARDYIAVSYSRQAMDGEDLHTGGHKVRLEDHTNDRDSIARDVILSRAALYARHVGARHIWIDCECIDEASKEKAMNSMDLVYKNSRYPLGLLGIVLSQFEEVELLQRLICGKFAYERKDGLHITWSCRQNVDRLMSLLGRLVEDLWWNRAWIFQEDYLGEPEMVLMLRYDFDAGNSFQGFSTSVSTQDHLWIIGREVCIKANVFRHESTTMLLALREQAPKEFGKQCEYLLGFFGKYNVLYRYDDEANGRAMSSRVFSDLLKRNITEKYDLLPIAANCCDHKFRLNSKKMAASPYSLGLCALTMYIRNGEIIANDKRNMKSPINTPLADFLRDISFDAFNPPVEYRELTWLKDCRFSNLELTPEGMHTTGHLWCVFNKFYITQWNLHDPPLGDDAVEVKAYETYCLDKLAGKLRAAAEKGKIKRSRLPDQLQNYLGTFWLQKRSSAAVEHMRLMAREIVRAITCEEHKFLSLARLERGNEDACAIFVGDYDEGDLIFTSWSSGEVEDQDGRRRTRHVGLKVRAETKGGLRVLRLAEWVNGLAFFEGREQEPLVFGWPEPWTKQPTTDDRKRKREDDDERPEVIVID